MEHKITSLPQLLTLLLQFSSSFCVIFFLCLIPWIIIGVLIIKKLRERKSNSDCLKEFAIEKGMKYFPPQGYSNAHIEGMYKNHFVTVNSYLPEQYSRNSISVLFHQFFNREIVITSKGYYSDISAPLMSVEIENPDFDEFYNIRLSESVKPEIHNIIDLQVISSLNKICRISPIYISTQGNKINCAVKNLITDKDFLEQMLGIIIYMGDRLKN